MLCPVCSLWGGPLVRPSGHHPHCPLGPALIPSEDGSCHCGSTVLSTDREGCLFCGGYTRAQLNAVLAALAAAGVPVE